MTVRELLLYGMYSHRTQCSGFHDPLQCLTRTPITANCTAQSERRHWAFSNEIDQSDLAK